MHDARHLMDQRTQDELPGEDILVLRVFGFSHNEKSFLFGWPDYTTSARKGPGPLRRLTGQGGIASFGARFSRGSGPLHSVAMRMG
jgi:hypothetical protein